MILHERTSDAVASSAIIEISPQRVSLYHVNTSHWVLSSSSLISDLLTSLIVPISHSRCRYIQNDVIESSPPSYEQNLSSVFLLTRVENPDTSRRRPFYRSNTLKLSGVPYVIAICLIAKRDTTRKYSDTLLKTRIDPSLTR